MNLRDRASTVLFTQSIHDVRTTLLRHCFNVLTSFQRLHNVVSMYQLRLNNFFIWFINHRKTSVTLTDENDQILAEYCNSLNAPKTFKTHGKSLRLSVKVNKKTKNMAFKATWKTGVRKSRKLAQMTRQCGRPYVVENVYGSNGINNGENLNHVVNHRTRRLVGGTPVSKGEWPWIVQVRFWPVLKSFKVYVSYLWVQGRRIYRNYRVVQKELFETTDPAIFRGIFRGSKTPAMESKKAINLLPISLKIVLSYLKGRIFTRKKFSISIRHHFFREINQNFPFNSLKV